MLTDIIKIRPNESLLVVGSDRRNSRVVSGAFYRMGRRLSSRVSLIEQPSRPEEEYMDEPVRAAIASAPDVVILTDVAGLGRDRVGEEQGYLVDGKRLDFIYYAIKALKRSRVFWFYVDSVPRFVKTIDIDYRELARVSRRLVAEMKRADRAHITSAAGTDLFVSLSDKNRKPKLAYDGTQHKPGSGGNLPMGEVLISPTARGTDGIAVIDGSFFHVDSGKTLVPSKPFAVEVEDGYVRTIQMNCREARALNEMVERAERRALGMQKKLGKRAAQQYKRYARLVGEFAIGVNPNARLVGDLLEDEKCYGTAHIAIGSSYDGERALIHTDMVMRRPRVSFISPSGREKVIVEKRNVLL